MDKHPHTSAVSIAADTMAKVIKTFGAEPKFMAKAQVSPRPVTLKRRD